MKGSWKEMRQRGDSHEDEPLAGLRGAGNQRADVSVGGRSLSKGEPALVPKWYDAEADILDSGFTFRDFDQAAIRNWLLLQIAGLVFQILLWREVSGHLVEFDEVVREQCAPEHRQHGVCVGSMWNLAYYRDVVLTGSLFDRHTFEFSTLSSPPTFLIDVDPVSGAQASGADPPSVAESDIDAVEDLKDIRWSLDVARLNPPHMGGSFRRYSSGPKALTFEDFSSEAQDALAKNKRVEWRATLSSRSAANKKVRFVVYVEDAAKANPAAFRSAPLCVFGKAWKAFNEQHQGANHRALSWCSFLLSGFVFIGGGTIFVVHREAVNLAKDNGSRRFHRLVLAKFLLQDIPQQACIVLFIFGWYEGGGLRCQLCMFRPEHCTDESPFHFANMVAIAFTLLSSLANQLLVRPIFKKIYTEDDICLQYFLRAGGVCVSVLPFTTGICLASRSVLPMSTLMHVVFALPCLLGWLSLAGLLCLPMLMCCDEDSESCLCSCCEDDPL
eukprot:CAMPEP_0117498176 /NCGR_PEP_ID=MMETSP0784-20121206/21576_1 /TAXON_ID=39447 /ORGANISM="" /LENGTH=498 /DNA_ID=CAMNT_0005293247 /DNA_START=69 /DNA_END=1565 /DNA_ORIENTATION=+